MKHIKLQEKLKRCKFEFKIQISNLYRDGTFSEINDYQTLISIGELIIAEKWHYYLFDEIEIHKLYSSFEIEHHFLEAWQLYWQSTNDTIFDIFNNSDALPNLLILEIANIIFGHRNGIKKLLNALEIPNIIDIEFIGIRRNQFKIYPQFEITAKPFKLIEYSDLKFSELIYADKHILHAPSLAPCLSHHHSASDALNQINRLSKPIIDKLATHNADIGQILFKHLNIYSTPMQALKNLRNTLIQSGEKFTHQIYTTFETSSAIQLFTNYLNLLPENLHNELLAIKSAYNTKFTLSWLLHVHLAQGRCVESAAQIIDQLIDNRNNHRLLYKNISISTDYHPQNYIFMTQVMTRLNGCVHEDFYRKQTMPAALPKHILSKIVYGLYFNNIHRIEQLLALLRVTHEDNLHELIEETGRIINTYQELIIIIIQLEFERMKIIIEELGGNGLIMELFRNCYENDSIHHFTSQLSPDYRKAIMPIILPHIVKKLTSAKAFLHVQRALNIEEQISHFELALPRLCKKIRSAEEYHMIAADCSETQKEKLLDAIKFKISALINTLDDYLLIKHSSPPFMNDTLFAHITPLLTLQINSCNDYAKLMYNSTKEQRVKIQEILKSKIPTLIANYYSFILFCRASTADEILWLFNQIKHKMPNVVDTVQDYINIIFLLPADCRNEFNFLMKERLMDLSSSIEKLFAICKFLPKEDQLYILWVMNYTGKLHKLIVSIDELEKIVFKIDNQQDREAFLSVSKDSLAKHAVRITQHNINHISQTELGQLVLFSDRLKINRRIIIDAARHSGCISSTAIMYQLQRP